jgi:hypothetical protein
MTYTLHVIAREVPADDADVFPFLEQVAGHTVSMAPSQQLKSFRDAALKLFPCLTSYGANDAAVNDCPWADGPLGDNFKGGYGTVAIARRHGEVIPHLLSIASDLGVTVADEQNRAVYRPQAFQVVLEGPLEGVEVEVAATQLAGLMNQPLPQMVLLLHSRRRTLVKKGLTRTQADVYVTALRERASCRASVVAEPPRKAVPSAARAKAPAAAVRSASPATYEEQVGIEPNDALFKAAEAQRLSAVVVLGHIALAVILAVWQLKSPFLMPLLVAISVLGVISVVQLEQALESGGFRKLVSAVISLVPLLGTLLVAWTYFRAAGVLKQAGLTNSNGLLSAGDVRGLGGLDEKAMLPSMKIALVLLMMAAIIGAMLMPKGH